MTNWYFGWGAILAAFVTGAAIGLGFHREGFLGGYGSFRRRILRLGHISLAALGSINVLYSVTASAGDAVASVAFVVGGVTMPAVCFLSAWREGFRHLFFVPVTALVVAAVQTLRTGPP